MSENQKQGSGKRPWYFRRKKKPVEAPKPKGNYAFIDSQNLNLGVQKMGWKMDWAKLREWLRAEYNVEQAFMFIGYMQENESLYQQMYDHGFLVILKPTVEIKQPKLPESKPGEKSVKKTDEPEKPPVKGNVDADLVLYAMKELPNYDKAIIISGDGDFFALVEYLIEQKKLLKLMTPNRRFSSLLQGFDTYIDGIDQHRNQLAYRDFRRGRNKRQT